MKFYTIRLNYQNLASPQSENVKNVCFSLNQNAQEVVSNQSIYGL